MKTKLTIKDIAKKFNVPVEDIQIVESNLKPLNEFNRGDTVTLDDTKWIVFNHLDNGTTQVVSKNFVSGNIIFDNESNNYATSSIRKWLNGEFYDKLTKVVGAENIIMHTVDLTTVDGRKDFGTCTDAISLPTFDFVRSNIDVFDKYRDEINDWQWLATAWSTSNADVKFLVSCLLPNGLFDDCNCCINNGVRAFCTLKSSILVSE